MIQNVTEKELLLALVFIGLLIVGYLQAILVVIGRMLYEFRPTPEGAIGIRSLLIEINANLQLLIKS